jgi:hypothetical protein
LKLILGGISFAVCRPGIPVQNVKDLGENPLKQRLLFCFLTCGRGHETKVGHLKLSPETGANCRFY